MAARVSGGEMPKWPRQVAESTGRVTGRHVICAWRAHIEGQAAGAKELLAVSPGSCSPLPRKHGGHCVQHALWLTRAGAKALAQPPNFFLLPRVASFNLGEHALQLTRDPDVSLRQ